MILTTLHYKSHGKKKGQKSFQMHLVDVFKVDVGTVTRQRNPQIVQQRNVKLKSSRDRQTRQSFVYVAIKCKIKFTGVIHETNQANLRGIRPPLVHFLALSLALFILLQHQWPFYFYYYLPAYNGFILCFYL